MDYRVGGFSGADAKTAECAFSQAVAFSFVCETTDARHFFAYGPEIPTVAETTR